jgi:PAS domain S-box-containing protein
MIPDQVDAWTGHRGFLDALDDAVLIIDARSHRIIDSNLPASILLGMSIEDMEAKGSVMEAIDSSSMGMKIEGLNELIATGEGNLSLPAIGTGGSFTVTTRMFIEGDGIRILLTIRKIEGTDRTGPELYRLQSAYAQLESEKHFGDAIIDFAESLIIGMDMDGTVTIFNRKAEQITGLKREQVLGRNYFTLFDVEKGVEGGKAWLLEMARGKRSRERIKVLPGRDSNPSIWWHNTVVQSGDRLVMVGIGVDITERLDLNHRLEDLNESLLLLNRIMRHDIMNDLNVALGSIQLYEDKRERRFLESATRSLTKSVDLIKDISDLERLRAPTDLRAVKVRDVIERVVENRAGQNVLINVSGEGTAMADEALSSVIDNLVGNAIMHGRSGIVDIDIKNEEGQCMIRVADEGVGIPDEVKARIFDEGFKFGETGNTGLGLYIVKKTMERYGGSVSVKDNAPQGSVFELRLLLRSPGGVPEPVGIRTSA